MNVHTELSTRLDEWIADQIARHQELTVESMLAWLIHHAALGLYDRVGPEKSERVVLEAARQLAFIETIENYPSLQRIR